MAGEAEQSDRILADARNALVNQRAGGRRVSIGRGSAELKRRHVGGKLKRIVASVLALVVAVAVFAGFPRMKVPQIGQLNQGDVRTLVGRTEVWLEAQRPALPAPAVQVVDRLGLQLDALGDQLETLGRDEPAAVEIRKLVGEDLPGMVSSYTRIPQHLRKEARNGRTPEQQLADGLGKISTEVDQITRQIAAGDIDALAVRSRYLDYKYGVTDPADAIPALSLNPPSDTGKAP